MSIYTRWGSQVDITDAVGVEQTGIVTVKRIDGGEEFRIHFMELKADGGLKEVKAAVDVAVLKARREGGPRDETV
jgi:hypothetical protein